jgi:hypothetical protein
MNPPATSACTLEATVTNELAHISEERRHTPAEAERASSSAALQDPDTKDRPGADRRPALPPGPVVENNDVASPSASRRAYAKQEGRPRQAANANGSARIPAALMPRIYKTGQASRTTRKPLAPRRRSVDRTVEALCIAYAEAEARALVALEILRARRARSRSRFAFWSAVAAEMTVRWASVSERPQEEPVRRNAGGARAS